MTSPVDSVVGGCYRKDLLKSRVVWKQLVSYIILVICNIRDAYLIDCCSFADNQHTLTQIVSSIVASAKHILLGDFDGVDIVVLGVNSSSDFIIMRKDTFDAKVARVIANDWSMHPLVVDVGGAFPVVLSEERLAAIGSSLADKLVLNYDDKSSSSRTTKTTTKKNQTSNRNLELGTDDGIGVDFVFLAGWLLGYPCIYYCGGSDSDVASRKNDVSVMVNGNALSGQSLVKFSLNVQLLGEEECIDVMTFTAPCTLLASGTMLHTSIGVVLQKRIEVINRVALPGFVVPESAMVREEEFQMTNVSM